MKCSVCKHPERYNIDCALLAGATLTSLAKPHGLSKSALQRHHVHLKGKIDVARQALEQSFQQDRLVHYARALERLDRAAEEARAGGDAKLSLQLTREANRTNKLLGGLDFHLDRQAVYRGLNSPAWPEQATVIPLDPHIYADSRRSLARTFAAPCPPPPRRSKHQLHSEDGCHDRDFESFLMDFPLYNPVFRRKYLRFAEQLKRNYPEAPAPEAETRGWPQPDPIDPVGETGTWDCQLPGLDPGAGLSDSDVPVPPPALPSPDRAPDAELLSSPPDPDRDAPGSELGNIWEISGKNSHHDREIPGEMSVNPGDREQPPPAVMELPPKPNGLFWPDCVFHGTRRGPAGSGPTRPSGPLPPSNRQGSSSHPGPPPPPAPPAASPVMAVNPSPPPQAPPSDRSAICTGISTFTCPSIPP